MAQARGSQTVISLYEEDVYAVTPATPSGQKLYVTSIGVVASQNRLNSNTLTSSRERGAPDAGNLNVSGSLVMEIGAESIGTLLKHALGSNSTTGTGPYTHVLTLGQLPVGFILEKDYGSNISGVGRVQYFNGSRIARAKFDFPQEGYCTATFDIIGANETLTTTPLDATITDNGHTSFSAFSASIEEGGSAIATVTQVSISLDNELDESVFTIGSGGQRSALPEGFATVTGSLTALFDSSTLLEKAVAGTESNLKVTLSRGNGLGSVGNESIEFFMPHMVYERNSPAIDGPGGILLNLNFKGYYTSPDSALRITLKNAVATI